MRKNLAAVMTSLIVLGSAYPVLAAAKNVYTDADSGFSMQSANPVMEYASRYSYGYQEKSSATDSLNTLVAIPAEIVSKKIGKPFTTKEFKEKLAVEMNKKAAVKSDYILFDPDTYIGSGLPAGSMEEDLFHTFGLNDNEFQEVVYSYETASIGKQDYYVISLKSPGAYDKKNKINEKAFDIKLYLTSENNILYLAKSYCTAENEAAKKAEADKTEDGALKKKYEKNGISLETATNAMDNPQALQKALLPITDSSLDEPKFQKALQKERVTALKGLTFFKPEKKQAFGMNDPVLKKFIPLPNDWLYLKTRQEIQENNGLSVNVAIAVPYTIVTNISTLADLDFDLNQEQQWDKLYDLYDESVVLVSYNLRKNAKNKDFQDVANEIFSIPQSDMQKAVDEMMPSLLNDKKLKEYVTLSNTKAKISNDGKLIKFVLDSNIKAINKYDFLGRGALEGTRTQGLLSLYIAKGDKAKTKSVASLADTIHLLPE